MSIMTWHEFNVALCISLTCHVYHDRSSNFTWDSCLNTFIAFFMYLQESFSMSWCDRIGCFSSSSTTMPGPCVHAPPTNSMMRAPVFGYVHCTTGQHNTTLTTFYCALSRVYTVEQVNTTPHWLHSTVLYHVCTL